MSTTPPAGDPPVERTAADGPAPGQGSGVLQRRTVTVLAIAQVFSGLGNGSTLALGSILAVRLSGSEAWAGATTTALTLAAAIVAVPLSAVAVRRGRRVALVSGLVGAMVGSAVIVLAVVTGLFALLLLGAALVGLATAVNLQSRFAAVDLAADARRGRDLSIVVWSITVGAVAGPNLVRPGAVLGHALGLPEIAGPFLISLAGMAVGAIILLVGLRPDPLLTARASLGSAVGGPAPRGPAALRHGWAAIRREPRALAGLLGVLAAHGAMVAVMSMTPLHLQHLNAAQPADAAAHLHEPDLLALIGFTISLHILGMYAFSPVMGWCTDRWGRTATLLAGQAVLVVAVVLAGIGQAQVPVVTVGLLLLGLGWSASTVAGSTLLAESVDPDSRVLAQGVSDTLMGAFGAVGSAVAGALLAGAGYLGLNLTAVVLLGVAVVAVLRLTRTGAPRPGAA
ncbi:MFS transporter [Tersicoccus solisilvae]|uniref:MFS transporter n=1 Tax=Tersicoccus solisilvae TaxID=1882339 RepID=A0ABQ1P176_9MICC|nr:MFS transporter [Tersicoccus solisilvae]GGC88760.1 MFS transporter [Tersicoccus solisilvae]